MRDRNRFIRSDMKKFHGSRVFIYACMLNTDVGISSQNKLIHDVYLLCTKTSLDVVVTSIKARDTLHLEHEACTMLGEYFILNSTFSLTNILW